MILQLIIPRIRGNGWLGRSKILNVVWVSKFVLQLVFHRSILHVLMLGLLIGIEGAGILDVYWVAEGCVCVFLGVEIHGLSLTSSSAWMGWPAKFQNFHWYFFFFGFFFWGGGVWGAWREELVEHIVLGSFGFCNLEWCERCTKFNLRIHFAVVGFIIALHGLTLQCSTL